MIKRLFELQFADGRARPQREPREQGPLARGQVNLFAVAACVAVGGVDGDAANGQDRVRTARVPAPYGFDASDEFVHIERLRQIVVGADVQAVNAVAQLVARR